MGTLQIEIQPFSLTSSKSFETVMGVAAHAALGHPESQQLPSQAGLNKDVRRDGRTHSRGRHHAG
jgi:hypothetical protein